MFHIMKYLKLCKLAMFYYSTKLEDKTNVCIFDTLGGKKVIYEEKNPSAPPVIDHQVRLCLNTSSDTYST